MANTMYDGLGADSTISWPTQDQALYVLDVAVEVASIGLGVLLATARWTGPRGTPESRLLASIGLTTLAGGLINQSLPVYVGDNEDVDLDLDFVGVGLSSPTVNVAAGLTRVF